MASLNFLVFLNTYSDTNPSNNPSLNNFKWDREIKGLSVQNPVSNAFSLAPGETRTLFNGMRTISQDGTTEYSLSLVPLSSNTYQLSAVSGTLPNFRTPRSTSADATTQLTAVQNGPVLTFSSVSVGITNAQFVGTIGGMTTPVTIAAVTPGTTGNVTLAIDGTSSINQLVQAWNTTHPSNQLVVQAGDDSQVPTGGSFVLSGGTNSSSLNLTGVQVGDLVRLGNLFNPGNQGEQKIISFTSTTFTVANELGVPEGPITLGSGFASQFQIYSAAGVQVGDKLVISGGFSPVTQGTYVVTSVAANYVQFYTTDALPIEGPIMTEALAFYYMAKQLIYMESDQNCTLLVNGSLNSQISPLLVGNTSYPGVLMNSSTIYSLQVTNNSTNTANLFLASAE